MPNKLNQYRIKNGFSKEKEKLRIMKKGIAAQLRVYNMENHEYDLIDHPNVIVYENGIVYYKTEWESGMVHITSCEIMWRLKPFIPPIQEEPIKADNVIDAASRFLTKTRKISGGNIA